MSIGHCPSSWEGLPAAGDRCLPARHTGSSRRAVMVILVVLQMMLLSACGTIKAPGPDVGTQLHAQLPKSILNLPFTDNTGQLRRLSDYAGKVLVISDSMTLCQETCPLDTATVVQTARQVEADGLGDKVQFLTITIDPTRDTVPQIAAYHKLFAGPPNWSVLTGSRSDVDRLWKYFGVYIKKVRSDTPTPTNWRTGKPLTYDIEHSDEVFFLDSAAKERFILEGMPVVQQKSDIPKVIYHFLSKDGRNNLTHPKPTAWTEKQAVAVLSWLLNRRLKAGG